MSTGNGHGRGENPSVNAGEGGESSVAGALNITEVLDAVAERISASERRQTDALEAMQARIARLSDGSGKPGESIPPQLRTEFDRLQQAIYRLMDASASSEKTEAPGDSDAGLPDDASAAQSSAADAPKNMSSGRQALLDPFEFADHQTAGNPEQPWDQESAEELTRLYETGVAGLPYTSNLGAAAPEAGTPQVAAQAQPGTPSGSAEKPSLAQAQQPGAVDPEAARIEREWLEDRFAEVAVRIEHVLASNRQQPPLQAINERFSSLEERLTVAVRDLARRSDVAGISEVEACISEMALQLERTHTELARVSDLEQQLRELAERVSEERLAALSQPAAADAHEIADVVATKLSALGLHEPAAPAVDANHIASIVAGRLADERPEVPDLGAVTAGSEHLGELKAMIGDLAEQRREEGEHTSNILETVQQAMIRLLDRMDAIEDDVAGPGNAARPAAPHRREPQPQSSAQPQSPAQTLPLAQPEVQPEPRPESHEEAPYEAQPEAEFQALPETAQEEPVAANVAPPEPPPAPTPVPSGEPAPPVFERKPGEAAVVRRNFDAEPAPRMETSDPHPSQRNPAEGSDQPPGLSLDDYHPRRQDGEAGQASDAGDPNADDDHPHRDRRHFMETARRAAQQANERARVSAERGGKPSRKRHAPYHDTDDNGGGEPVDAGGAGTAKRRIVVGAIAVLLMGAGATAFWMNSSSLVKRHLMAPQTQKQEMLGHNGTTQPAPAKPPAAIARDKGDRSDAATVQDGKAAPAGVQVTADQGGTNPADTTRHRQNAIWSSDGTAKPGQATKVPASLIPSETAPGQQAPITADGATAKRAMALPSALVGPLSLRLAAASGDPSAEFEVGARYAEGKGPDQDFKQAITWYRRAATRGFALAQYRLATLYERGLGVAKDPARAKIWYQRAAAQGNIKAMHNLAVLAAGTTSGKPDYGSAAHWFEQAAERGLGDSQFNLAILYQSGLGVSRDLTKSYVWFGVAARYGDEAAKKRQADIARQLTAVNATNADRVVSTWRKKATSRLANNPRYAGEQWKQRARRQN